jgi:hypothetical protein
MYDAREQSMSDPVHEVVIFGLQGGASREAFVADIPSTDAFLARQPGFLGRTLLAEAGGSRWVDLVRWESVEAADRAFQGFERECGSGAFARAIDQSSVVALRAAPPR